MDGKDARMTELKSRGSKTEESAAPVAGSQREIGSTTRGAQTIHRAIKLIKAIARRNSGSARLSELASETELKTATAHRILRALVAEGLVAQSANQKVYKLGNELYALGRQARDNDVRSRFEPLLVNLAELTADSVYLSLRAGHDAVYVERISGSYPIQALPFDVGSRWPLGIGAPGVAILAALPEREAEQIIQLNAPRYSKIKGVTADEVKRFVKAARRNGYAYNHQRFTKGVAGISIPILDQYNDPIAAVSIVAVASRLDVKRRKNVAELIKKQLALISQGEGIS